MPHIYRESDPISWTVPKQFIILLLYLGLPVSVCVSVYTTIWEYTICSDYFVRPRSYTYKMLDRLVWLLMDFNSVNAFNIWTYDNIVRYTQSFIQRYCVVKVNTSLLYVSVNDNRNIHLICVVCLRTILHVDLSSSSSCIGQLFHRFTAVYSV